MSSALVRKSLELFEDDYLERDAKGKVKKKQKNVFNDSKRHKTKKHKKLNIGQPEKQDNTEKNLRILQALAEAARTEESHTKAVFGRTEEKAEEVAEESTLFTDEDFEKFQKEYNFKT